MTDKEFVRARCPEAYSVYSTDKALFKIYASRKSGIALSAMMLSESEAWADAAARIRQRETMQAAAELRPEMCLSLPRSPQWPHFRERIIADRGGKCELSGETTDLEAHHIIPFHFGVLLDRPRIELDPRNIFVLSGAPINYHLLLGHLGCFTSFNLNVRNMARFARVDVMADHEYLLWRMLRPKPWGQMDDHDKAAMAKLIDEVLPVEAT